MDDARLEANRGFNAGGRASAAASKKGKGKVRHSCFYIFHVFSDAGLGHLRRSCCSPTHPAKAQGKS